MSRPMQTNELEAKEHRLTAKHLLDMRQAAEDAQQYGIGGISSVVDADDEIETLGGYILALLDELEQVKADAREDYRRMNMALKAGE